MTVSHRTESHFGTESRKGCAYMPRKEESSLKPRQCTYFECKDGVLVWWRFEQVLGNIDFISREILISGWYFIEEKCLRIKIMLRGQRYEMFYSSIYIPML